MFHLVRWGKLDESKGVRNMLAFVLDQTMCGEFNFIWYMLVNQGLRRYGGFQLRKNHSFTTFASCLKRIYAKRNYLKTQLNGPQNEKYSNRFSIQFLSSAQKAQIIFIFWYKNTKIYIWYSKHPIKKKNPIFYVKPLQSDYKATTFYERLL